MTATATMTEKSAAIVDIFDSLLRGELSAIETYRQAQEKLGRQPLQELLASHGDSAVLVRKHIESNGGEGSKSSGPWGAFAKLVEGTATVLGEAATLKALKEGEEHGLKEYLAALENDSLGSVCRELATRLAGKQREHIAKIDSLLQQAK
jgi:Domain of unknown function (DUF2383)